MMGDDGAGGGTDPLATTRRTTRQDLPTLRQRRRQALHRRREIDREADAWMRYFSRLTPRQLIAHLWRAQRAAERDPSPEAQAGASMTCEIIRHYLRREMPEG